MADLVVDDIVDASPKFGGKDPLAGGERLHAVPGTDKYTVSNNWVDVPRKPRYIGVPTTETPFVLVQPAHKTKNLTKAEQLKVAKGRVERPFTTKKKK